MWKMGLLVASWLMMVTLLAGCTPRDEKSGGNPTPGRQSSPAMTGAPVTLEPRTSWRPCGPGHPALSAEPDYSDFIMHAGRMYVLAVDDAKVVLGTSVGRVRCRLRGSGATTSYLPRDGDAAFVAAGTRLYPIRGRSLAEALAVVANGTVTVYEVER